MNAYFLFIFGIVKDFFTIFKAFILRFIMRKLSELNILWCRMFDDFFFNFVLNYLNINHIQYSIVAFIYKSIKFKNLKIRTI